MRPLLEYDSPHRMLYLVLRQHASLGASFAVSADSTGHLFLLACGCLVAQRCHARRLDPELSLRPHARWPFPLSARHLHANSLPASLCLPTATTTSGMPCPATACEPRSICVVPCTPSSLCTCKLACQTAANDVAATAPSGSSCPLLL